MSAGKHTAALVVVGRLAIAELAARKDRAQARTNLSKLRRAYLDETGELFDEFCHGGEAEDFAIIDARKRRDAASKALRQATSKLRAAIARATGTEGATP